VSVPSARTPNPSSKSQSLTIHEVMDLDLPRHAPAPPGVGALDWGVWSWCLELGFFGARPS